MNTLNFDLYNANCLDILPNISNVSAIITDLPYGTTGCKWDTIIPLEKLWPLMIETLVPDGVIVLFGSEPFSSRLRMSNINMFKYDWIWEKGTVSNPQLAKYMPLKNYEIISVFGKGKSRYNPQGLVRVNKVHKKSQSAMQSLGHIKYLREYVQEYENYPKMIQKFKPERGFHPTQKPVELLEYLVLTYTSPFETVLDCTMGSGSTGVACVNTNRNFIGVELDEKYFNVAEERVENARRVKNENI